MEGNGLREKLVSLMNQRVQIETKSHHIGFLMHKGLLVYVGDDFIEVDCGNKGVLIPISEIRTITLK